MSFTGILLAVGIVAAVGLFIGIFLGIASVIFKVNVDEREEKIVEVLPGNNCGGCGYPGCSGLAAAIVKGEADVGGAVIESPKKAADVFSYADEQLDYLRKADAMAEVLPFYAQNVREENSGDSITAASDNDVLYAFPKTADNGYFMYYDKRVFSEGDVGDMDTMIQKAAAADKNVYLNFGNAYYSTGFFFTAGIEFHFENGVQKDDYDIEQAVSAAKAMCHIAENVGKGFSGNPGQIGDNAYIEQGFQENTLAAAVTGTWMGPSIRKAIDTENLGAAKLPTVLMDGEQKQLHSFGGYKMIGVSKFSSFPFSAQTLAYFLTCEENQLKRHTERGAIPTNRRAAASDEVSADPALQAIKVQRPYAHPLGTYAGGVYGASGIASVGENQGVAGKRQSAVLEQLKIVPLPLATRKAEDIPTGGINDKLNVEATEAIEQVEVFNITGAKVFSKKNYTEKAEINTANLPAGTYVIRMTTKSASEVRSFVKF